MANEKEMNAVKWLMCLLALVAVVLAALILNKVSKKCTKDGYTGPNSGMKLRAGLLANWDPNYCNNNLTNEQFYCNNGFIDSSSGDDCSGNLAFMTDGYAEQAGYTNFGTCSKPIPYQGGELCSTVDDPNISIVSNNCAGCTPVKGSGNPPLWMCN
jgi:hypothetical protein